MQIFERQCRTACSVLTDGDATSHDERPVGEYVAETEVSQAHESRLDDRQRHWLVLPSQEVRQSRMLMRPDDGLDQLLPVTSPGDEKHEARRPDEVSEEEHPVPDREGIDTGRCVTVDELGRIQPQIVTEPAHQIERAVTPQPNVPRGDRQVLPVPVEGDPAHGIEHPKDGKVESIEGGDVADTDAAGSRC